MVVVHYFLELMEIWSLGLLFHLGKAEEIDLSGMICLFAY